MAKPLKQEQEAASDEISEVAPGVLRLQLPIKFDGLGHVNTYALLDARGAAIMDPGLPGKASWQSLQGRLRAAGIPLGRVHTVIVTHSHPDHFGGAGKLAEKAGATLVSHRSFTTWATAQDDGHCANEPGEPHDDADSADGGEGAPWSRVTPWGTKGPRPPRRQLLLFWAVKKGLSRYFVAPRPDRRVSDGDEISLAGRSWRCVHTPGHTRDHLCLYDQSTGTLLSGDHVLPTITPHVAGLGGGADPLSSFVESLDRVARLGPVSVCLPAHGHPFTDLPGRVGAIKAHHRQRLDSLREASAALGPADVTELSHQIFSPRRWGAMAESETFAHLEHLRLAGEAERHREGETLVYMIGEPSKTPTFT